MREYDTFKSTIKVLENTLQKSERLKIETAAKSHVSFIICQFRTEYPKKYLGVDHNFCIGLTVFV